MPPCSSQELVDCFSCGREYSLLACSRNDLRKSNRIINHWPEGIISPYPTRYDNWQPSWCSKAEGSWATWAGSARFVSPRRTWFPWPPRCTFSWPWRKSPRTRPFCWWPPPPRRCWRAGSACPPSPYSTTSSLWNHSYISLRIEMVLEPDDWVVQERL